jgi:hypothetical protein
MESMFKKTCALALSMVAIISGAQNAVATDYLFKKYAYDSPISNYTETNGYYDCSSQVGTTAKCTELVFIENKFTASLVFKNDKLSMVSLRSPFERELYLRAMAAIRKSFGMVVIGNGQDTFDVLLMASKVSKPEFVKIGASNYERMALAGGHVTYTFIDNRVSIGYAKSFRRLLEFAPDNVRTVDLIADSVGKDAYLILKFSFPKLDQKKLDQQANKPVESF